MKEHPILFSGPMVRAILDGRKTQTRRVVKPQPSEEWCPKVGHYHPTMIARNGDEYAGEEVFGASDENEGRRCPYGVPGARLWVRETWQFTDGNARYRNRTLCAPLPASRLGPAAPWKGVQNLRPITWRAVYRADGELPNHRWWGHCNWHSSIFMPRWASRITLGVKAVRVERLQEISELDAIVEGVDAVSVADVPRQATMSRRADFCQLWDSINAKRGHGWETNPWVWVVEFERVIEPC